MSQQASSHEAILSHYAGGPSRLEAVTAGLPEGALDCALSHDSWTIRQIVHHLADGDDLWKMFVKQAIGAGGSDFSLEWYWQLPQDEWARCWGYGQRAIGPSLALFRASREHTVQLLALAPEAWEQTLHIRTPDREEHDVTVECVISMQARHVDDHVDEIRKIRDVHGLWCTA